MSRRDVRLCLGLLLCLAIRAAPAQGFEVVFDYRYDDAGFFAEPERRAVLEEAARLYTHRLDDGFDAIPEEHWTAVFPHPGRDATVEIEDLPVAADTLLVFVGAQPLLERGRLARGGPGSSRLPCREFAVAGACGAALLSFLEGLGLPGTSGQWAMRFLFRGSRHAQQYPPTDFAPWGGSLSFASDAPWHFGLSGAVPPDRFDFLSSAVHELGHVLGIGTAESWGSRVPRASFEGEQVLAEHGAPPQLDGDFAHWAPGTTGRLGGERATAVFVGALAPGERLLPTELDLAALRDIGWALRDSPTIVGEAYGEHLPGDIDGDGQIGARDAALLEAWLQRQEILAAVDSNAADVAPRPHGDGQIDGADLELLRAAIAWAEAGPRRKADARLPWPAGVPIPPEILELLRPRIDASDLEAFDLLGWDPPTQGVVPSVSTRGLTGGDLDGDGQLTASDLAWLQELLELDAPGEELSFAAADVHPMFSGNATGDGVIDARDLALLRQTTRPGDDSDGDGIPTAVENELNYLWFTHVGRPRHSPLVAWSDRCLVEGSLSPAELLAFPGLVLIQGTEIDFQFCSRDGTPWSTAPGISPEEARELVAGGDAQRHPRSQPVQGAERSSTDAPSSRVSRQRAGDPETTEVERGAGGDPATSGATRPPPGPIDPERFSALPEAPVLDESAIPSRWAPGLRAGGIATEPGRTPPRQRAPASAGMGDMPAPPQWMAPSGEGEPGGVRLLVQSVEELISGLGRWLGAALESLVGWLRELWSALLR